MTSQELIEALRELNEAERQKVLKSFCRSCGVYIGEEKDWSGGNYCFMCSPDPKED